MTRDVISRCRFDGLYDRRPTSNGTRYAQRCPHPSEEMQQNQRERRSASQQRIERNSFLPNVHRRHVAPRIARNACEQLQQTPMSTITCAVAVCGDLVGQLFEVLGYCLVTLLAFTFLIAELLPNAHFKYSRRTRSSFSQICNSTQYVRSNEKGRLIPKSLSIPLTWKQSVVTPHPFPRY